MSRTAGPACQALRRAIAAGVSGTYTALAEAAGLAPDKAQATLKEMSRRGESRAHRTARSAPAIYGQPVPVLDALAHVQQAWR